ncbi:MAG: hypothetical protein U9N54_02215 [candidate division Zixibacteria bacterium]|nr:hypothetical protein [candidate division Zixibacteria bacterium]
MKKNLKVLSLITITCLIFIVQPVFSQNKLPADKAGTIGQLTGKIAFIRDGNIWTMNANGENQMKVSETTNATGRLSWSPQGDKIIFTRSGSIDLKGPDMLGGNHKVYDLFIAYPDSAINGNSMYWYRYSNDLGSRDPEWQADGTILFWKDLHANQANAVMPNYQICTMDKNGDNINILRKDWQNMTDEFLVAPSMNTNGDLAFVAFFEMKFQGLVVLSQTDIMTDMEIIKKSARKSLKKVAPVWSPDNKWIAYVKNDLNSNGLYITNKDLTEDYLVFAPPVSTYISATPPSFSPDSKWITFSSTDGAIWIVDITGNGARRLTPPGIDKSPAWSQE